MNILHIKLLLAATLISLSMLASANSTFETSSSYAELHYSNSYRPSTSKNSPFLMETDIEGLTKFDSSLGTLNSISVTAAIDFFSEAYLFRTDISSSVKGFLGFDMALLVWSSDPQRNSAFIQEAAFSNDIIISGNFNPEFGAMGFQGNGGFFNITKDISNTSTTDFDNFIGIGDIDSGTLTLGVIYPESLTFSIDNGTADVIIHVEADITVTYGYSPVPLPSSFWLLLSSSGLIVGFSRQRRS